MSAFSTCPRKIAIVGYGGAQSLDLNGPFEVFAMANRFGGVVRLRADPGLAQRRDDRLQLRA